MYVCMYVCVCMYTCMYVCVCEWAGDGVSSCVMKSFAMEGKPGRSVCVCAVCVCVCVCG